MRFGGVSQGVCVEVRSDFASIGVTPSRGTEGELEDDDLG